MPILFEPIGVIHTPFASADQTPGQGTHNPDSRGAVEVFPEFAEGLKDLETFTHIILLYHFDRAPKAKLVLPGVPDKQLRGVFASRHPCRPNGIGFTVARLLSRAGNRLEISGVDILDGTPLLDIKPYMKRFDCFSDAGEGWTAQ
jgi:tRNA-Thr(GGU) m(6)t(6)A37 methyltransferase TsaA